MEVHRGEVFYADLAPVVGSEQGGVRQGVKTLWRGGAQDGPGAEWACRPGGGHRSCHD